MARLIAALFRHGEYEQPAEVPSAHLPHPLTPAGERQAEQAGRDLLAYAAGIGAVIAPILETSRMLRAWQTASKLQDVLRASGVVTELREVEALAERCVGSLANLTVSQIEEIAARDPRVQQLPSAWKSTSDFRLPFQGAESLLEAGARVAAHLEQSLLASAVDSSADTLKIFVGHGGAFRHAALALGALPREAVAHLSMYHCRPVYLERKADGNWRQVGGEWKKRASYSRHFD